MSEEEIISRIYDLIHTCDFGIEKHGEYDDIFELDKEALQGLLDLYNKKKEENQELINEIQDKEDEIRFANKDIKVFETNFISKDKIREIIKKHEEARDIAGEQLTTRTIIADSDSLNYGRIQAHNVAIKDLQELLEE